MLRLIAVGAEGGGSGEGGSHSPENFCIFYFKMVSFCAWISVWYFDNLNIHQCRATASRKCLAEQIDKVG